MAKVFNISALIVGMTTCQALAEQTVKAWPIGASYAEPTDRYDHNIMGRIQGWGRLEVDLAPCSTCRSGAVRVSLDQPQSRVFEDFAPRLWDITGDGVPEIVTVESDLSKGARLTVWEVTEGSLRRLATTAYLGTRHRWLAPVGAADFDRDGAIEIAYVEKPHLARVLRLVRLDRDQLMEVAFLGGVTNHAIGQEKVESLVRSCRGVPEIVALSADGQQVLAITWDSAGLKARQIGRASNRQIPAGLASC
ncbi:MAG: hypothetical protein CFE34_12195 [Rhodobacteraceae bacterium PARR1]|nr:MAG: hypothetical protein CFE34_12195 [Rhodobacteraceae bacterium PARR1]